MRLPAGGARPGCGGQGRAVAVRPTFPLDSALPCNWRACSLTLASRRCQSPAQFPGQYIPGSGPTVPQGQSSCRWVQPSQPLCAGDRNTATGLGRADARSAAGKASLNPPPRSPPCRGDGPDGDPQARAATAPPPSPAQSPGPLRGAPGSATPTIPPPILRGGGVPRPFLLPQFPRGGRSGRGIPDNPDDSRRREGAEAGAGGSLGGALLRSAFQPRSRR